MSGTSNALVEVEIAIYTEYWRNPKPDVAKLIHLWRQFDWLLAQGSHEVGRMHVN